MRLLFLAPRYPHPPTRGDHRRVFHMLEGFAREAEAVTFLSFGSGPPLPFDGVRVRTIDRSPLGSVRGNLTALDPRLPLQVRLFLDSAMRRAVLEETEHLRPDVAYVTLSRMAPYMPPAGSCHRHLDLVDALAVNMATRAAASKQPAKAVFSAESRLIGRYEAKMAAAADSCSLVSDFDRLAAPGLERAVVSPNGVDLDSFPFADPGERPPVLLFFGNLGYFHNVEPARYVATEVVPRVRAEMGEARLRLAGARPAQTVRALDAQEGVEVVGPVESMADELHGAAAAVVPMFSGSGVKNKVLEAFCTGTPVVTNAAGIQGVTGAEPGRHYLAGESPDELAAACVRLLREPGLRRELAAEAFALVEREFTWQRQVDGLMRLF